MALTEGAEELVGKGPGAGFGPANTGSVREGGGRGRGEREREKETETERKRDRDRDRETDRETDRGKREGQGYAQDTVCTFSGHIPDLVRSIGPRTFFLDAGAPLVQYVSPTVSTISSSTSGLASTDFFLFLRRK